MTEESAENFGIGLILKSFMELDVKRSMLYLSNAPFKQENDHRELGLSTSFLASTKMINQLKTKGIYYFIYIDNMHNDHAVALTGSQLETVHIVCNPQALQFNSFSFISFLLITYRGQMAKLHIIYKYNLPIKTLKYTDTSKLNAHQKLQINTYMHTDEK